jgi:hypothetical protein
VIRFLGIVLVVVGAWTAPEHAWEGVWLVFGGTFMFWAGEQ